MRARSARLTRSARCASRKSRITCTACPEATGLARSRPPSACRRSNVTSTSVSRLSASSESGAASQARCAARKAVVSAGSCTDNPAARATAEASTPASAASRRINAALG